MSTASSPNKPSSSSAEFGSEVRSVVAGLGYQTPQAIQSVGHRTPHYGASVT